MNISQIKSQIGQPILNVNQQLDPVTKLPTEWASHWDNANRVRVTMHISIWNLLQTNKEFDKLAFKTKPCVAKETGEPYTHHVITTPSNLLGTL